MLGSLVLLHPGSPHTSPSALWLLPHAHLSTEHSQHAMFLSCNAICFPLMFSFPPTLQTHQAPFLSALEPSSCPVRQEGHVEGILGGLYLPAHDLRNQTNKSPREHCDKQTWFYISPSTQNTAMHLSSLFCEDQHGISSLAGRAGTVLFSL